MQRQRAADRDYDQVRRPRSLIVEVFDPTPQEQSDQLVAGGGSAAGRVSLARDIIRDRQAAGLTQAELAALARTRQETILRIESGKYTASHRLIDRIDRALTRAATKRKTKGR
ncbi:MAG TPA: helix-turn-helix transcriptional regulator [Pirellulales bacterium]|nr:helix-turn-helix transcriptional regulator [Pirellulales bacterium]